MKIINSNKNLLQLFSSSQTSAFVNQTISKFITQRLKPENISKLIGMIFKTL